MNENKPENPKAFPLENDYHVQEGMDLRDYFAAKAMQSIMKIEYDLDASEWAKHAYAVADAMLKQREL